VFVAAAFLPQREPAVIGRSTIAVGARAKGVPNRAEQPFEAGGLDERGCPADAFRNDIRSAAGRYSLIITIAQKPLFARRRHADKQAIRPRRHDSRYHVALFFGDEEAVARTGLGPEICSVATDFCNRFGRVPSRLRPIPLSAQSVITPSMISPLGALRLPRIVGHFC
jgi:hypothetical protein